MKQTKSNSSKRIFNAQNVDASVFSEENGSISIRKAPWHETNVISDKPQVIPGRLVCSGDDRGDYLDFKPYAVTGIKPFTEIMRTKHCVVRTTKRTVQVNFTFSKDISKSDVLRYLKGEHKEITTAIKPFKENVEWEEYKE